MKYIIFVFLQFFLLSAVSSQVKKPAPVKTKAVAKMNPVVSAPFVKRKFTLDTAVFMAASIDTGSTGYNALNIKMRKVKSAKISISDASYSTEEEMTEMLEKTYGTYRFRPDGTGFTYNKTYTGKSTLSYNKGSISPIEYKLVYHGTKNEQERDKAMALMPKARELDAKPAKPVNQYDTDENNRIVRIYMLPYAPGLDKGFILLNYEANYGDDNSNNGAAALQTLINGISPMKINEQIIFSKVKDTKSMIDIALPALSTGDNGRYSFPKTMHGSLAISAISNATAGYATSLENYSVNYGSIVDKTDIVEEKLQTGIRIYSRTFTIENKSEDYTSVRYQVVNVLVPDKKIIKQPLLITLTSYSPIETERNSLNAFILNSISLPGTLTKAGIEKVKEVYSPK
jgi:hypothetical protein